MTVEIGHKSPAFSALDDQGNSISLQDFKGKTLVLYFYPKDDTPGCTLESCGFRDVHETIQALGAEVVGVSKDSVASHKKFREKYQLPFRLIADTKMELCKAFHVLKKKKLYGKEYEGIERSTFIIDREGVLRQLWRDVSVPGHIEQVLEALHHVK